MRPGPAILVTRVRWRSRQGLWYEDRAPRLGAALAFYTVFALAPG